MGPSPNCNPIQIASARAELNGTVDTAIQALAAKATFSISLFTRVPFLAPTFPELSEVEWCGYEWCGSDGLLTPASHQGAEYRCDRTETFVFILSSSLRSLLMTRGHPPILYNLSPSNLVNSHFLDERWF